MQASPLSSRMGRAFLTHLASWLPRPRRLLVLLLLCTPLAWASVSITGMVITTLQQISFAQDSVDLVVNQTATQTATSRYSRGPVTYVSSHPAVAEVDARSGAVTALQVGSATITATQAPAAPYPSASARYTVRVSGQAPVFNPWALAPVVFGTPSFNLAPPTSNSQGAITYSSENPAVADVTPQGMVEVKGVGRTGIVAQQAAQGGFAAASTRAELEVLPVVPVLTWSDQMVTLGTTITLQPPASQTGLTRPFTYTVADSLLADVTANQITGRGVGTTRIRAQVEAGGNHAEASVEAVLTVRAADFFITGFNDIVRTFDAVDSAANAFDLPDLDKPSGSSAGFSFTSSDPSVATVAGQRVTVLGVGSTTLTATLSADPLRHGPATASVRLQVLPALPLVTFAPIAKAVGDAAFVPAFISNSGGAVTFSLVNPEPPDLATLASDGSITPVKPGTATLMATQVEAGHFAASTHTTTLTITAQPLVANTLALAPFEKLAVDTPFVPAWTLRNSTAEPIVVTSSNSAVATVGNDAQTVTLTGLAGTSLITLTQQATPTHAGASVSALMTVRQQPATAASLTLSDMSRVFGDAAFTPQVGTSSDGAVSFSSGNEAVAVVDSTGRFIRIVGAGRASITARVASTARFQGAEATATLTVNPRDPGLQVRDVYRQLAMGPFDLAVEKRGNGVVTVTSSNAAVATVGGAQGLTITPLSPGQTTVTVTVAEDANHTASSASARVHITAEQASLRWSVPPQIVFDAAAPTLTLPVLESNNRSGAISYSSSDTSVATLVGNTLTLTGRAGSVTLTATQAPGDGYVESRISANVNVVLSAPTTIEPVAPTLVVDALIERSLAQGAFRPAIQTNSPGAITLSVLYGPVTLGADGRTLTPTASGEAAVKVVVAATAAFTTAERTIVIKLSAGAPVIEFAPMTRNFDDADLTFDIPTPLSNSPGAFTYISLDPGVAEIVSGTQIKVKRAGTAVIRAVQAAAFPYESGQADTTLTVHAQPNTLSFGARRAITRSTSDLPFALRATSNSPTTIEYLSTNEAVATIDANGVVTLQGAAGSTVIVATQVTGWTQYAPGRAEIALTVTPPEATGLTLFDFTVPVDRGTVLPPYTTLSSRPVVVEVDNALVATVEPDGQTLRLLSVGTAGVTVKHPATDTQAEVAVRAVLTVGPATPVMSGLPTAIERTWTGTSTAITLSPLSPSNGEFRLSSDAPGVAQVNGLTVTLVGPGTARLTLTQGPDASWSGGSVVIPVTVNQALASLDNMTRSHGDPGFELPAMLGGVSVSYTSDNPAVALIGGADSRTVSLTGVGTTVLTARSGANGVVASAVLTVQAGLPRLILADTVLPSTTLATTLRATSSSTGAIRYAVTGGATGIVRLDAQGMLLVQGTGTVQVTATQAPDANHLQASVVASITIAAGDPGFVVTSAPAAPVLQGGTFEIRYRANSLAGAGDVEPILLAFQGSDVSLSNHITLISQSIPTRVDEDGVMVFRMAIDAPVGAGHRIGFSFRSTDPGFNTLVANSPPVARNIEVAAVDQQYNLGLPFTLDFNIENTVVVPSVRDSRGNLAPLVSCNLRSSNPAVLREDYSNDNPHQGWRTVGVGEATLSCSNHAGVRGVTVTVLPGDPKLRGFESMSLSLDAPTRPIVEPVSLNTTGAWTYEILNSQSATGALVAVIENGAVVARAPGSAVLRARQAAAGAYRAAHVDALISVSPSVLTGFQDVTMTFGDADFRMPLPGSSDTTTPFVLTSSNPDVATISDLNRVSIRSAGTAIITATQGQSRPVTAVLTVRKAVPRLVLRVKPWVEFEQETCPTLPPTLITWPLPNQTTLAGVSLVSDSDGAVQYGSSGGFFWNWNRSQPTPGNVGQLALAVPDQSGRSPRLTHRIWVTQAESANHLSATSEAFEFMVSDSLPATAPCSR
ncbi:MAG: Ig-like domain-containing protein [Hydrogenophaga sp.]|uniref:Ig-like domain-containing protein n=1 Tax=Hydrogenophaga sp. TaxID=1904254 RepID=UPI002621497E|nr:Ig-like domain-containing protein [Hydrogenophaga sp.]MDM7942072.1 Ig-like domain-containing protein [Hydrogenophaga sp.]